MSSANQAQPRVSVILSWTLVLMLTAITLLLNVIATRANWSLGWSQPSPVTHTMPEGDLASLWMAGHLARLGHLDWLYNSALFASWRQHQFGTLLKSEPWVYPPTVLLIGVPLSFVPLLTAFLLWDVGTLFIAVLLLRRAQLSWPVVLVGLGAPATWRSLILGQYGTITGSLVVAGLLLAPTRPLRAGIMLGLSTLKPQQGLIVPVAWLAARNWRAVGAAAAVFAVMALMILTGLGGHAWVLFVTQSSITVRTLLEAHLPQPNINTGVSTFWMARTLGFGLPVAYAVQDFAALTAIFIAYRAWRLPDADPLARMAVTVCLSLIATPYGYTSDMVAYSVAVTVIVANNRWRLRPIDALLWLWPGFCPIVTIKTGVLLTPIAIATAATLSWRQMKPMRLRPTQVDPASRHLVSVGSGPSL